MKRMMRAAGSVLISRRFRALLSVGMLVGVSVVGTLALWSSTVATQSGVFTTATINIQANTSKNATLIFAPTGILPGQSTATLVTVTNTGSAAFQYRTAAGSSTALGQAMTVTAAAGGTATGGKCTGGTSLATNSAITASTTPTTFMTGRGPVAATTGTDTICIQLNLPLTAQANLAGTTGSVVFTFTASAGS